MDNSNAAAKKNALIIAAFLLLLSCGSLACLLLPRKDSAGYIADIYQNGVLIRSIPLDEIQETRSFIIKGENGCTNEIEIRPGSIGIISADCPDKICVSQGFVSDARLPITCLPNRLVIQLRPATDTEGTGSELQPDIITY